MVQVLSKLDGTQIDALVAGHQCLPFELATWLLL